MITISSDVLQTWVIGLLMPMFRILAMISVAPIFSHGSIPVTIKIVLGFAITVAIMPMIPVTPTLDLLSMEGLLVIVQQILVGLSIGFSMTIVFAAVEMMGQVIGMTMGLGFATFFDPQSQGQSNAISQFYLLLGMLIFLSINGHLLIISALANSFITMPISTNVLSGFDFMTMAMWGEKVFSAGLLLSLPGIAMLLIANISLGILTRTAPQLNIFGIGFPITISMGFIVIVLTMPQMLQPIEQLIQDNVIVMNQVGSINSKPK
jgi:flagellar biosynthetic protein FliR